MDWFKWLAGGRHRGYGGRRGHHGGEAGGGHGHGGGHGERGDHGSHGYGGHGWGRQGVQRGGGWNDARDGAPLRGEAGAPAQHAACAKCGAINGAEAKFCAQCGAARMTCGARPESPAARGCGVPLMRLRTRRSRRRPRSPGAAPRIACTRSRIESRGGRVACHRHDIGRLEAVETELAPNLRIGFGRAFMRTRSNADAARRAQAAPPTHRRTCAAVAAAVP
ncbi:hypothetical protein NCR_02433 [Burkholderia pseudomallei]